MQQRWQQQLLALLLYLLLLLDMLQRLWFAVWLHSVHAAAVATAAPSSTPVPPAAARHATASVVCCLATFLTTSRGLQQQLLPLLLHLLLQLDMLQRVRIFNPLHSVQQATVANATAQSTPAPPAAECPAASAGYS
jgi:hypothetical protein